MTRWWIRTATVVCWAMASAALAYAQQPAPPAPADLAAVVGVARDPAATPAQKDKLVGKTYAGVITIQAIRLGADPSIASIWALAVEPASTGQPAPIVRLTFEAQADNEKVQQLRPNQQVRVRATLKSFSQDRTMASLNFSDLVVEGPAR